MTTKERKAIILDCIDILTDLEVELARAHHYDSITEKTVLDWFEKVNKVVSKLNTTTYKFK